MDAKHKSKFTIESFIILVITLFALISIDAFKLEYQEIIYTVISLSVAISYFKLRTNLYKVQLESTNNLNNALLDKLTGLYNRNYFDNVIKREFSRADRVSAPLSIIYFDIDKFKLINDNYGHDIGDEILITVAQIVKMNTRETDITCRWGGDEFILILPNTKIDDAHFVAEKIRFAIEDFTFSREISITVSLGIAQRVIGEYYSSLFRRVDKALYYSKDNGRNQISLSSYTDDDLNLKYSWLDSWNSGNQVIDNQHLNLIDITNKLSEVFSIKNEVTDQIIELCDSLVEDCENHFKYEIGVLRASNYPDVDNHEIIHKELLEKVSKVKKGFLKGNIGLRPYLNFIFNELIINHLVEEDHKFFDYVNGR